MNALSCTLITGAGATVVMDIWGWARQPLMGATPPDYGLVGRWIAGLSRGQFRHDSIAKSPPVNGERLIGWTAHYLTGIAFAALLIASQGTTWLEAPTLMPALIVGVVTVLAPFLLMQPGMGAGIAASRTSRPASARVQSLITHAVFGCGLYAAGLFASLVYTS